MSFIDLTSDKLPAPRLEFVWEQKNFPEDPMYNWECSYNLVIPLSEHDIRRERADGTERDELPLNIGKTRVGLHGGRTPVGATDIDTPFRDGAHAGWDSIALRGLPVYAVCGDKGFLVSEEVKMIPAI